MLSEVIHLTLLTGASLLLLILFSYVNELNKNPHLPKKLQYDFLLNSVKPRKRFSPWARKDSIDYLELVKEYYGYNDDKALQALRILNKDQLDTIKKFIEQRW